MKTFRYSLAAAIIAASAGAAMAASNYTANQINPNVFEITARNSGDTAGIWCGASRYARDTLKASWQARIYVARTMGTSQVTGRKGAVQFTLDPAAVGITPITSSPSLNSFVVGDSQTIQMARKFCNQGITGGI
ncbi:hypothetical protein [Chachezhania sediminis]|uniref:hypothetical protein n=1 Tax=Chachezhania sediminis TaxID=2599291 RepID=UPI00131E7864|nr:hypothetical protein [Chachezhania sediminis]